MAITPFTNELLTATRLNQLVTAANALEPVANYGLPSFHDHYHENGTPAATWWYTLFAHPANTQLNIAYVWSDDATSDGEFEIVIDGVNAGSLSRTPGPHYITLSLPVKTAGTPVEFYVYVDLENRDWFRLQWIFASGA